MLTLKNNTTKNKKASMVFKGFLDANLLLDFFFKEPDMTVQKKSFN